MTDEEGKEEYEKTMKNTGYYIFNSSQVLRLSEGNKNVED